MKGIPLSETGDASLVTRGYNLALKLVPNVPQVITEEQLKYFESHLPDLKAVVSRIFEIPDGGVVTASTKETEPAVFIPNLRQTGPTLADWLSAREQLHRFFTGESIILRDRFVFTDEQLARTDLIPVFRPVGATNRKAVEWKQKLGVTVYEEVDVMRYKNSGGPKIPELYLINRSVRPDDDTLGEDNKKSPDELILVPHKLWLGLYGWSDADTLHFAITREHLDPQTWTWFPNDRLPDGRVADGYWRGAEVYFRWDCAGLCHLLGGARAAVPVPLRS